MATEQTTSPLPILGRLFWMLLGPMVLLMLTVKIIQTGTSWFTPVDIAYLVVLAGMVLARWLEFRSGEAQTSTGEPATPAVLKRYVLVASVLGLSLWGSANLIGINWLGN